MCFPATDRSMSRSTARDKDRGGRVFRPQAGPANFNVNVSGDLLYGQTGKMKFTFDSTIFRARPSRRIFRSVTKKLTTRSRLRSKTATLRRLLMLVREYEETENYINTMTVYEAIDKIALMYSDSTEPVSVADIFMSYAEDGRSGIIRPAWTGICRRRAHNNRGN